MRDLLDDDPGLAAAGTGQDKQGAIAVPDCVALGLIEGVHARAAVYAISLQTSVIDAAYADDLNIRERAWKPVESPSTAPAGEGARQAGFSRPLLVLATGPALCPYRIMRVPDPGNPTNAIRKEAA
jgi:hypothetical protein